MTLYLIEMFGISLVLTLIIELVVAGVFQVPLGKDSIPVVLVNCMTNPVAVLLCWLWRLYLPEINVFWLQIPMEIVVCGVEFLIYKSFKKSGWKCANPFKLALLANGSSWLLGVLLSFLR